MPSTKQICKCLLKAKIGDQIEIQEKGNSQYSITTVRGFSKVEDGDSCPKGLYPLAYLEYYNCVVAIHPLNVIQVLKIIKKKNNV